MEVIKEIDWTKPVQMRNGTKLHVVTTDGTDNCYPVVSLEVDFGDRVTGNVRTHTLDGRFNISNSSDYDAINVPEEEPMLDCNEKVLDAVSDIKNAARTEILSWNDKIQENHSIDDIIVVRSSVFAGLIDELIESITNY